MSTQIILISTLFFWSTNTVFVGYIEEYVENKVTMLCWMIVFAKKKIAKGLMLFVLIKVFTSLIN